MVKQDSHSAHCQLVTKPNFFELFEGLFISYLFLNVPIKTISEKDQTSKPKVWTIYPKLLPGVGKGEIKGVHTEY